MSRAALSCVVTAWGCVVVAADATNVEQVTEVPGLVAFWDFARREPVGERRFTAHVPPGTTTDYPLDAANYVREFWDAGRAATYADFPELGRGPFGNAVRIVRESDTDFRPFLYVPRERLHDTPLDINMQQHIPQRYFIDMQAAYTYSKIMPMTVVRFTAGGRPVSVTLPEAASPATPC